MRGALATKPAVVSSIMGLYPPDFVDKLKKSGIAWFATVSTVAEARAAEDAGADVVVAQGMEAGGHRVCFDAAQAERQLVGLFALVPAVVDAVKVPVVATGGIADARGVAAALLLGALLLSALLLPVFLFAWLALLAPALILLTIVLVPLSTLVLSNLLVLALLSRLSWLLTLPRLILVLLLLIAALLLIAVVRIALLLLIATLAAVLQTFAN